MSDTMTDPHGEVAADPAQPQTDTQPPAEQAAPAETTETSEAAEAAKATEEHAKATRGERRIAAMSARLAHQAAEIEELRRQIPQQKPEPARPLAPEDVPRAIAEGVRAGIQQEREQEKAEAFRSAGAKEFPDWQQRCQALIEMGADAPFSHLLVELPDGAKVAAALAEDPEAAERIIGLKSPAARALALGRYSAEMANRAAEAPITQAPPPIRPISAPSRVAFNQYTASADQLTDYYSKLEMKKRGL